MEENTKTEENLITIDLNKHIVVPIKEPFTKEGLIAMLAAYWGYAKGEEKIVRKTYSGTIDDLLHELEGKEFAVLGTNADGEIVYDVKENVPYKETRTEWVISKYLKPSTDALFSIIIELQTKEEEERIKSEMEAKKAKISESLEIIRDIKLQ
jgi:hypothetical protein